MEDRKTFTIAIYKQTESTDTVDSQENHEGICAGCKYPKNCNITMEMGKICCRFEDDRWTKEILNKRAQSIKRGRGTPPTHWSDPIESIRDG